jgi:hypothetical protein
MSLDQQKLDSLAKWLKQSLPSFDWILRQKENIEYYQALAVRLEKRVERLERRLSEKEKGG